MKRDDTFVSLFLTKGHAFNKLPTENSSAIFAIPEMMILSNSPKSEHPYINKFQLQLNEISRPINYKKFDMSFRLASQLQ